MKGFKLFFFFCVVYAFSVDVVAQQNRFKNERRIYLWDVTLSMKGFKGRTPDIYDKVITALEKDINTIIDEQTEIWVFPFQTSILDKLTEIAANADEFGSVKSDMLDTVRQIMKENFNN